MNRELVLIQMQFQYWLAEAEYWRGRGPDFDYLSRDASQRALYLLEDFERELSNDRS